MFLQSKRSNGSHGNKSEKEFLNSYSDTDNETGMKNKHTIKRSKPVNLVNMNDLIEEITREFDKEKKINKQVKPVKTNGTKNICLKEDKFNYYNDIDSYLERNEKIQKQEVKKIKRTAPPITIPMKKPEPLPKKIDFIKTREMGFSFNNFQRLTLKFRNMKAKVKAEFLTSSIHKPDIINIKDFSTEYMKDKFNDFLYKLKLGPLAQFLAENIITCFTLFTEDLTMKDRETLDSYYKIIYSFQFDNKFAILENALSEDKLLIMIESSKFPFSSCLPDFEFFIISISKSLFLTKNEMKIEKNVINFSIEKDDVQVIDSIVPHLLNEEKSLEHKNEIIINSNI
jgi:hypothetical protein